MILLSIAFTAFAQRPKVGVVLCGGGAKGAAHVGVLKVLEENGIPIDYIAGTSMGAIVGGLYAIGYSAADLDSLIMHEDWTITMSDRLPQRNVTYESKRFSEKYILEIPFGKRRPRIRMTQPEGELVGPPPHNTHDHSERTQPQSSLPSTILGNIPMALIGGQNIYNLFTKLSVGYQDSLDFNNMPIPFACVAVDLLSKKEIVFRSGNFVDAIRASMAIPGVFAPVQMDGMVLVDGGVTNTFPVDVAKAMGADIVIGVWLDDKKEEQPTINNIGDMFNELLNLYMNDKIEYSFNNTDILIAPVVKEYGTMSFDTKSLRSLMDIGASAAKEKETDLRRLKALLDQKEEEEEQTMIGPQFVRKKYNKAIQIDRDSITIGTISFSGISASNAEWLIGQSKLKPGIKLSGRDIEETINDFYSTSAFSSVTYSLKGKESPFDMGINFVPGYTSQLGVGIRFDTEEIAKILLNVSVNNRSLYGSKFSLEGVLAYNSMVKAQYAYAFRSLAQFNISYGFRDTDMDIFNRGQKFGNVSYQKHMVDAGVSSNKSRLLHTQAGARFESFNFKSILTASDIPDEYDRDLGRNNFLSVYGEATLDQRDKPYFPEKGVIVDVGYSYYFNILSQAESPFSAANFSLTGIIPMTRHVALIPSFHSRVLYGESIPICYMNLMGGYEEGRYMTQQIPFIGFNNMYAFEKVLASASVDLRVKFLQKHYITASAAYALDSYDFSAMLSEPGIFGTRLGYAYNSVIGPVSFNLHWSDYSKKVGFYMSLGYSF